MADATDKALAITQGSSLGKYATKNLRAALTERLTLSEAVGIVGRILDCYPNGGKGVGKGYVGALAQVLCSYPRTIAGAAADPVRGVVAETEFMPPPAKLLAWLERKTGELRRPVDVEDYHLRLDRERMERRVAEEQREDARKLRPSLDELRARHGPSWGIKQMGDAEGKQLNERKDRRARAQLEANARILEREWAARGMEPMYAAGGLVMSPELVDVLSEQDKRRAAVPAASE